MSRRNQIYQVTINGKEVTAINDRSQPVTLTRQQRMIFTKYRNLNFLDMIYDEFQCKDILCTGFKIIKDGEIVYPLKDE